MMDSTNPSPRTVDNSQSASTRSLPLELILNIFEQVALERVNCPSLLLPARSVSRYFNKMIFQWLSRSIIRKPPHLPWTNLAHLVRVSIVLYPPSGKYNTMNTFFQTIRSTVDTITACGEEQHRWGHSIPGYTLQKPLPRSYYAYAVSSLACLHLTQQELHAAVTDEKPAIPIRECEVFRSCRCVAAYIGNMPMYRYFGGGSTPSEEESTPSKEKSNPSENSQWPVRYFGYPVLAAAIQGHATFLEGLPPPDIEHQVTSLHKRPDYTPWHRDFRVIGLGSQRSAPLILPLLRAETLSPQDPRCIASCARRGRMNLPLFEQLCQWPKTEAILEALEEVLRMICLSREAGAVRVLLLLLQEGIDPETKRIERHSALWKVARYGTVDRLHLLLQHCETPSLWQSSDHEKLLVAAVCSENPKIFQALLEYGVRPTSNRNPDCEVLVAAVKCNQPGILKMLMDHSTPFNFCHCVPHADLLIYAVQYGYTEIVELLLEYGLPPKDSPSPSEATLMEWAIDTGEPKIIKALLEHGASVDYEHDRCSKLLKNAVYDGNYEAVELLLRYGAPRTCSTLGSGTICILAWRSEYQDKRIWKLCLSYFKLSEPGQDILYRQAYLALINAIKAGNYEQVYDLLESGLSLHAPPVGCPCIKADLPGDVFKEKGRDRKELLDLGHGDSCVPCRLPCAFLAAAKCSNLKILGLFRRKALALGHTCCANADCVHARCWSHKER